MRLQFQTGTRVNVGPDLDREVSSYRPIPLENNQEIERSLTPSSIRAVPISLVATVLTLFLLAIGPGDYYLLGLFKARKFTWILFPLVSIGFTAFMIHAAQKHMGSNDARNALVFVDLDENGQPVRTSRFELIFTATEKQVDTELSNSLYARFDPPRTAPENEADWSSIQVYSGPGADAPDAPWIINRVPTSFVVRDDFMKWSPKLNRYSTLGSAIEPPDIQWGKLPADLDSNEWQPFFNNLAASFPDAEIYLLPGGSQEYLNVKTGETRPLWAEAMYIQPRTPEAMQNLIRDISAPPPLNLLQCVSQISPTGAGDFEDLALFDATDPQQALLIVVTRDGDDWIVYRKLFRNEG